MTPRNQVILVVTNVALALVLFFIAISWAFTSHSNATHVQFQSRDCVLVHETGEHFGPDHALYCLVAP